MSGMKQQSDGEILTTSQVARLFNVSSRTVTDWANTGKLPSFSTPGGHKRFRHADIAAALSQSSGTE